MRIVFVYESRIGDCAEAACMRRAEMGVGVESEPRTCDACIRFFRGIEHKDGMAGRLPPAFKVPQVSPGPGICALAGIFNW